MYDVSFFHTRLGHAALASITAMVAFVALSTQIAVTAPSPSLAAFTQVQVA